MSDTYTKLFSSITESTIVSEPLATRWLWVTMLAMADAAGCVYGSIPGLARRANISLVETEAALATFYAPDAYSRTKENGGRRIEDIDGGWRLLNHAKYAAIRSEVERADYKREWDRTHRPSGHQRAKQSDSSPTVRQKSDTGPTKPDSPTPPDLTPTQEEQEQKTAPKGDLLAGVSPQVAADFKALRTRMRAAITKTAIDGIAREAAKAGMSLEAALAMCCERGWRGFKADWVNESRGRGNATHRESAADRVARINAEAERRERGFDSGDDRVVSTQ